MKNLPSDKRRKLRIWSHGEGTCELQEGACKKGSLSLLDLASNDYLGLSKNPRLIEAAQASLYLDGVGAGGSRLVTGSRPIHSELEEELAHWLNREKVLLFPSGFQANLAAVVSLASKSTIVLADRLIHHSLLIGVKASGAKLIRFTHNDIIHLEQHLKLCRHKYPKKALLVLTESLFSMEGTSAPLSKIAYLCKKYGAKLLVDEAHALGVMGSKGRGCSYELSNSVDLISGTFGKAFGSGGAFLACNEDLADHLLQTSGAFKYTTALAPPLTAAALAALKLIKDNPHWGLELQKQSMHWRHELKAEGWYTPPGNGQILSLIIGSNQEALSKQSQLEAAGLLSVAIRPPTVPEGTARLRIVLRRDLPKKTLGKLLNALKNK